MFDYSSSHTGQRGQWTWRTSLSTITMASLTATHCMKPPSPVEESSTQRTTSKTERWWGHTRLHWYCFTCVAKLYQLVQSSHTQSCHCDLNCLLGFCGQAMCWYLGQQDSWADTPWWKGTNYHEHAILVTILRIRVGINYLSACYNKHSTA